MRLRSRPANSSESPDESLEDATPRGFPLHRLFPPPAVCFAGLLSTILLGVLSSSKRDDVGRTASADEIAMHGSRIDGVAFSPDGRFAASASSDRTLKIWDLAARSRSTLAISKIGGFSAVAFSPDGRTLASGTLDGKAFLLDLGADRPSRSFRANETGGSVRAVAFSPDGATLATGGDDRAVHLWDAASGRERLVLRGHEAKVSGLAFTPDGETILSISTDGRAIAWDAQGGHIRDRIEGGCGPLWSIAVSSDGRWAAFGGREGIVLRDLEEGSSRVHRCSQIAISSLAFLPSGDILASASLDGTAMLWKVEPEGLRPLRTLDHPTGLIKAMAVSNDGETLVTGGNDGILRFRRLGIYKNSF